jgi:hypothetical protein
LQVLKLISNHFTESKNQESPEQETNGAKADFSSALQNPNLLIALAQSGAGSAAAQFAAMPVSLFLMR